MAARSRRAVGWAGNRTHGRKHARWKVGGKSNGRKTYEARAVYRQHVESCLCNVSVCQDGSKGVVIGPSLKALRLMIAEDAFDWDAVERVEVRTPIYGVKN